MNKYELNRRQFLRLALGAGAALSLAACGIGSSESDSEAVSTVEPGVDTPPTTQVEETTPEEIAALEQACGGTHHMATLNKDLNIEDPATRVKLADGQNLQGDKEDGTGYEDIMTPHIRKDEVAVVTKKEEGKECSIPKVIFRPDYLGKIQAPDGAPVGGETPIFFDPKAFR